ncbi:MAG: tetratricopeptide repeat protein [Alphaproteobacteria bacterium]|nr:tetratricopeptide repeat protein [Alphaproteobacteria bacterium]
MTPDELETVETNVFALFAQGRLDEALALGVQALERAGERPRLLLAMGLVAIQRNDPANARTLLEAARALAPRDADIAYNLGVALQQSGALEAAGACWEDAVRLHPGHLAALKNLAALRTDQGRFEDVPALCRAVLAQTPDDYDALNWMGFAHGQRSRFADAEAAYRALAERHPQNPDAHYRHGIIARDMGDDALAVESLRRAVALDPGHVPAHFALAQALLAEGRYAEGFAEYEWRKKRDAWPTDTADAPEWRGETDPAVSLLVTSEQGHGDTLQFLRFLPQAAARVGRLTVSTHPSLRTLVERLECVRGVEEIHRETATYDRKIPIMSLPHVLGITDRNAVPSPLFPDVPRDQRLFSLGPADPLLRVGVVWSGNAQYLNNARRSCAFTDMARLFDAVPDAAFYSFHRGEPAGDFRAHANAVDMSPHLGNFEDTARFVKGLDLVVSVDTAFLHLAGSMGMETWALLHHARDWRWKNGGRPDLWYPGMRIYLQPAPDDWTDVFDRVIADLRTKAAQRNGADPARAPKATRGRARPGGIARGSDPKTPGRDCGGSDARLRARPRNPSRSPGPTPAAS